MDWYYIQNSFFFFFKWDYLKNSIWGHILKEFKVWKCLLTISKAYPIGVAIFETTLELNTKLAG